MTPSTSYNHSWHVIVAQNLVFCEMEKMLVVTPAGYAALEFDPRNDHHDCHVVRVKTICQDLIDLINWGQTESKYITVT